ncbi:cell division protein FtsX [Sphingomonas japonica]|uniref:Cell division transport system permease protein n=1 Tax=Sphingomonas japonica TaxID=511662 RepID=A0ABX0U1S0_9SPHN|nr:permease [Sphingomonas japonica]NIJ23292.1 cell division transport system permease protein [Sphingomonas japonica]
MSDTPRPGRAERRILDASLQTRAMTWVMGVMLFLTVLAAAMGFGMANAARAIDADLSGRLTVQIVTADADTRTRAARAMAQMLRVLPMVAAVRPVDEARLAEQLRPWLGDAGLSGDLPIPAMIDVDLKRASPSAIADVERAVRAFDSDARVDAHADWIAPVRRLIASFGGLALGVVLLTAGATLFVVVLTARAGLEAHRGTIDVMHILGSTDVQVARLFQRRIGVDTLLGGLIGSAAALALVLVLQRQFAAIGSQLLSGGGLAPVDWTLLLALPLIFAALAMLAARWTVLRALGKMP